MHNVGNEVIGGVLVHCLHLFRQVFSQIHIRNRKVDNSWILLHKEIVLSESLNTKDEIWRQLGELEALQKVLLVSLIFLLSDAVELGQDVEEGHLGDNELLLLVLVQGAVGRSSVRYIKVDSTIVSWYSSL